MAVKTRFQGERDDVNCERVKREEGKKRHLFDILANTLNLPMYRRFRIYVRFEFLRVVRVHTICSDSEKTLRLHRNRGNVTKITRMVSEYSPQRGNP